MSRIFEYVLICLAETVLRLGHFSKLKTLLRNLLHSLASGSDKLLD